MKNDAEYLRYVMQCAKGDDLERATRAFAGLSPEEMSKEYGQSGRTRLEILNGYKTGREEWESANRLLDSLLRGAVK